MKSVLTFSAGFVAGWLARSTVDSSRDLVVRVVARARAEAERVRRALVAEQEFFEDLWAEADAWSRSDDDEIAASPEADAERDGPGSVQSSPRAAEVH